MPLLFRLISSASFILVAPLQALRADDADDPKVRQAVVKIHATIRPPDVYRPWMKSTPQEITGSGVVVTGKRILTNAHMVSHASQVFVKPNKSSEKLLASVESIAAGIDLAILKLDDPGFFDGHPALPTSAKVPSLQQTVYTYGYPEGGTELATTRGIVSRIEFGEYYGTTEGLRIQIDAAINPGNSGGPVVVDGRMVGLVFSKLQQADNIGYIIPMEEIELFLHDVQDGRYDGKPVFIDELQNLENDALRARLKLHKKTTGILVRKTTPRTGPYPLQPGDVITQIGNHPIDNMGMVQLEADRLIRFQYRIQQCVRDNQVALLIVRDGKELKVDVPVGPEYNRWLVPFLDSRYPSYFIYGPLVFTELTDEYVRSITYAMSSNNDGADRVLSLLNASNPIYTRYGERPAFAGERLVVVCHPMFTHKISKGYKGPYTDVVAMVNGIQVRNLKHLVTTLRNSTGEFIEFKFHGSYADTIVFNRKEVLDATEEILNDNGIRQQYSTDIGPVWNQQDNK
jgi:S1-C subfamily serine protease